MQDYNLDPPEYEEKYISEALIAEYQEKFEKYILSDYAQQEMRDGMSREDLEDDFWKGFDDWYSKMIEQEKIDFLNA
jgi:hypothetical protein